VLVLQEVIHAIKDSAGWRHTYDGRQAACRERRVEEGGGGSI